MSSEMIKKYFDGADMPLSAKELSGFTFLFSQYKKLNKEWDLSRLTKDEDIIIKHFIDSVLPSKLIKLPKKILDIGTGPGFPGLPIKITNPSIEIILAESRFRRVDFMNMIIKELSLDKAVVYPHLVNEECSFDVDGIITRAFESANGTLLRVNSFLKKDGRVVLLKGPGADDDIKDLSDESVYYFELENDVKYKLPYIGHDRRILVFRKTKEFKKTTYRILMNEQSEFKNQITSPDNKKFKDIKKAIEKGPSKSGLTIIPGKKIIKDLMKTRLEVKYLALCDESFETDPDLISIAEKLNDESKLLILKKSLFSEIEPSKMPFLVIDTPEIEQWNYKISKGATLVIPFQDPLNVGSAVRSAVSFGIKDVILLQSAASPYHPKSVRASSGAVFSVKFYEGPQYEEIASVCEENSIPIVCLDKHGQNIRRFDFPESFLLLSGIEGQGIPEDLKKYSVSIPISENIESLNAYAALSIALYEYSSRPKS